MTGEMTRAKGRRRAVLLVVALVLAAFVAGAVRYRLATPVSGPSLDNAVTGRLLEQEQVPGEVDEVVRLDAFDLPGDFTNCGPIRDIEQGFAQQSYNELNPPSGGLRYELEDGQTLTVAYMQMGSPGEVQQVLDRLQERVQVDCKPTAVGSFTVEPGDGFTVLDDAELPDGAFGYRYVFPVSGNDGVHRIHIDRVFIPDDAEVLMLSAVGRPDHPPELDIGELIPEARERFDQAAQAT